MRKYWANTHGYFGHGGNSANLNKLIARKLPACEANLGTSVCNQYFSHMHNSVVPNDGLIDYGNAG